MVENKNLLVVSAFLQWYGGSTPLQSDLLKEEEQNNLEVTFDIKFCGVIGVFFSF